MEDFRETLEKYFNQLEADFIIASSIETHKIKSNIEDLDVSENVRLILGIEYKKSPSYNNDQARFVLHSIASYFMLEHDCVEFNIDDNHLTLIFINNRRLVLPRVSGINALYKALSNICFKHDLPPFDLSCGLDVIFVKESKQYEPMDFKTNEINNVFNILLGSSIIANNIINYSDEVKKLLTEFVYLDEDSIDFDKLNQIKNCEYEDRDTSFMVDQIYQFSSMPILLKDFTELSCCSEYYDYFDIEEQETPYIDIKHDYTYYGDLKKDCYDVKMVIQCSRYNKRNFKRGINMFLNSVIDYLSEATNIIDAHLDGETLYLTFMVYENDIDNIIYYAEHIHGIALIVNRICMKTMHDLFDISIAIASSKLNFNLETLTYDQPTFKYQISKMLELGSLNAYPIVTDELTISLSNARQTLKTTIYKAFTPYYFIDEYKGVSNHELNQIFDINTNYYLNENKIQNFEIENIIEDTNHYQQLLKYIKKPKFIQDKLSYFENSEIYAMYIAFNNIKDKTIDKDLLKYMQNTILNMFYKSPMTLHDELDKSGNIYLILKSNESITSPYRIAKEIIGSCASLNSQLWKGNQTFAISIAIMEKDLSYSYDYKMKAIDYISLEEKQSLINIATNKNTEDYSHYIFISNNYYQSMVRRKRIADDSLSQFDGITYVDMNYFKMQNPFGRYNKYLYPFKI